MFYGLARNAERQFGAMCHKRPNDATPDRRLKPACDFPAEPRCCPALAAVIFLLRGLIFWIHGLTNLTADLWPRVTSDLGNLLPQCVLDGLSCKVANNQQSPRRSCCTPTHCYLVYTPGGRWIQVDGPSSQGCGWFQGLPAAASGDTVEQLEQTAAMLIRAEMTLHLRRRGWATLHSAARAKT